MTYIGIDLGTSAVKAVLVDRAEKLVASALCALNVKRPHPHWSEQDPADWIAATIKVLGELRQAAPDAFRACEGIGLSGQMHGAVLLDEADTPLRRCILWNDGRSVAECGELEAAVPDARTITGNIAMPGFTAPKLAWVRKHEPEIFAKIRHVLLPKAYLRLVLAGEHVEDMSDASGTLWLDVGRREWSDRMIEATGLRRAQMPRLVEGSQPCGRMRRELSASLGFDVPPVLAGSAGDNAAGAIGLGAVNAGDTFLSLGTSGVLWRTTAGFEPRVDGAVHAFCHALPGLWHQMSVHLSAASSLKWWSDIAGCNEADLLAPLGDAAARPAPALFTPYLSGERTPHNDPHMRGSFIQLGHETDRAMMTQAVLEGVAFAFKDGKRAIEGGGALIESAMVIGGGGRSRLWLSILANVLGIVLRRYPGAEASGAFGAARLARLAATGETPSSVCRQPAGTPTCIAPDMDKIALYAEQYERWQRVARFNQQLARRN